jgi:hypothetical protein
VLASANSGLQLCLHIAAVPLVPHLLLNSQNAKLLHDKPTQQLSLHARTCSTAAF